MCVRAEEWLTDDKGALAYFLLWTALAVEADSELSLLTGKVSSDSDNKATDGQPSFCLLPEDIQAEVRMVKTQPEVQSSQHRSSFPVTLDCVHNHLQHCSPASLPLHCPPPPPPPQPPSYAQSLAKSHLCHSESISDPPAYTSAHVVTQPPRVLWTAAPTGSNAATTGPSTQVLRRIQSFTSSMAGSAAASSVPSATHIYSQKLSRPTSAGQGNLSCTACWCFKSNSQRCSHLFLFVFLSQWPGGALPVSSSQTQWELSGSWALWPPRPSPTSRPSSQPCRNWQTSRLLATMPAPVTSTCWHNM